MTLPKKQFEFSFNKNNGYSSNLIIDTDIGNDIDDALALSMAHYLHYSKKCRLIGIAINKDNKYAAEMVDIINTYYRSKNIKIGVVDKGKTPDDGNFLKPIAEAKIGTKYKYPRSNVLKQDAVKMYRKLLSESEDGSVIIVSIGFMTNLASLLVSSADNYSKLNGAELVAKKVKILSVMAGNFTEQALKTADVKFAEYNVKNDIKSAQFVCDNWTSKIVFSGLEIGNEVLYPAEAIYNDYNWSENHPIVDAYKLYLDMPYDRPTWDLTAILCLSDDCGSLFDFSDFGKVSVTDKGVTVFEAKQNGLHRYLIFKPQNRQKLQDIMRKMCAYNPCDKNNLIN